METTRRDISMVWRWLIRRKKDKYVMIQDGNESWIDEPNALEEYYIMGGEGAFPKLESGRFGIWEKALMCY